MSARIATAASMESPSSRKEEQHDVYLFSLVVLFVDAVRFRAREKRSRVCQRVAQDALLGIATAFLELPPELVQIQSAFNRRYIVNIVIANIDLSHSLVRNECVSRGDMPRSRRRDRAG